MEYRIEKDTLGEIKVNKNKYWGAQTQRSLENFKIGPEASMPLEVIHAFAIVKKAAAITNNNAGILTEEKKNLILAVCDEITNNQLNEHFPLVIWQTGSGTQTNMNVNEVIANRAHHIQGGKIDDPTKVIHPNDDVNKSQSSNDTFPTAMNIAAYQLLVQQTIPALKELHLSFIEKTKQFDGIVKIGRTHTMDATPLTLGQEFSGFAAQLAYGISTLIKSLDHLSELALGGTAVGTGINTPLNYAVDVSQAIAALTSLPFKTAPNKFEALSAHDALVESSSALKQIAIVLMNISNNIRLLASGPRCGVAEIILPANEPGSSIMPGKVNPTQCEAMTMVCARVIGNDTSIGIGGMNGQFQLNVFRPMMIDAFLQSARLLADASRSFNVNCVEGISANHAKIKTNLENSLMLVTALNPHIGYENAAKIAKAAYEGNTTLKQAALKSGLLSEKEFDEWVNPEIMI